MRLPDIWLFLPAFLLSALGLLVTLSIVPEEFTHQAIFILLSIGIFFLVSRIDFRMITALSAPIYAFQILLLVITLLLAEHVRGSRRWLVVGGLTLQTSELMKPVLIIALSYLKTRLNLRQFSHYVLALGAIGIPGLLVFLQPDLGSTIVIISIGLYMLLAMKPAKRFITLSLVVALVMLPLFWYSLAPYQKARVETFLNPHADPLGASYNQIQAVIAVGSGEIIGKGLGKGTQSHLHFLPEKHTDFFFASLAEELGFLGSSLVIILFGLLSARLIYLAQETEDVSVRLVFLGTFVMFFFQAAIHIGISIGILPVTGITLPLLSVGGSSSLACWLALGIASSASREVKVTRTFFLR